MIDYNKLEQFRKKISEKSSIKNLMTEIRDLMAELVALEHAKANSSTITNEERKPYMDPTSDKFKEAMKELSEVATIRKDKGETFVVLYRATEDLEYPAAKDKNSYNTGKLASGKGAETNWFISMKGAESKRVTKNPLVQCLVPVKKISGFIFPPSEKASPSPIDNKFEDVVEVLVKPGSYKIEREYLGDS